MDDMMNVLKNRKSKDFALSLNLWCAVYILVWTIAPPLALGSFYRVLVLTCTGLWFLTAYRSYKKAIPKCYSIVLVGFGSAAMMAALLVFTGTGLSRAVAKVLYYCIIVVIGSIGIIYYVADRRALQVLVEIILLILIIFGITTIRTLQTDPYASRIANSEWLHDRWAGQENTGRYGFVYMAVQAVPLLVYSLMDHEMAGRRFGLLRIGAIVVSVTMVLLSGYTYANILLVGQLLYLFARFRPSQTKTVALILLAVFLLFFFKTLMDILFQQLIKITADNPAYNSKVRDIYSQLFYEANTGDSYARRIGQYEKTWKALMDYPLLGSYIWAGKSSGGGHTFALDQLAEYGLLICYGSMYAVSYIPMKLTKDARGSIAREIVLLSTLAFCLIDPLSQEQAVVWFILMPFICFLYCQKTEKGRIVHDSHSLDRQWAAAGRSKGLVWERAYRR